MNPKPSRPPQRRGFRRFPSPSLYPKQKVTFFDVLAFVRRETWAERYFLDLFSQPQSTELLRDIINHLVSSLSEAA